MHNSAQVYTISEKIKNNPGNKRKIIKKELTNPKIFLIIVSETKILQIIAGRTKLPAVS